MLSFISSEERKALLWDVGHGKTCYWANERHPGQIDQLLNDLVECPPPEEPTERAFLVGALINPLPALGVALEIRPKLLTAVSAEERIDIARDGIYRSIRHMDGTAKMW